MTGFAITVICFASFAIGFVIGAAVVAWTAADTIRDLNNRIADWEAIVARLRYSSHQRPQGDRKHGTKNLDH